MISYERSDMMTAKGTNKVDVKIYNRASILKTIRNKKVARKDLANILQITPAAITNLVNEMIEEGIIEETGETEIKKSVGRKKTLIRINPKSSYLVGVDIETDSITISISNLYNEIIGSVKNMYHKPNKDFVFNMIAQETEDLLLKHKIKLENVLGVGVGVVGLVDSVNGISKKAYGLWKQEVNIKQELEQRLNLKVVVDNNVRALALSETELQDYNRNMIFIKYGPGIGASLIIQNEIYSGATYNALEFGHTIIEPNGKLCKCGQTGCLETIGSINYILEEIESRFHETSKLKLICNNSKYDVCVENIIEAYMQEDKIIEEIVHTTLNNFAMGIVNLIKVLDTKAIAIYSPLFESNKLYQLLLTKVDQFNPDFRTRIRRSVLGTNMSVGALSLVRKKLFYDTGGITN